LINRFRSANIIARRNPRDFSLELQNMADTEATPATATHTHQGRKVRVVRDAKAGDNGFAAGSGVHQSLIAPVATPRSGPAVETAVPTKELKPI